MITSRFLISKDFKMFIAAVNCIYMSKAIWKIEFFNSVNPLGQNVSTRDTDTSSHSDILTIRYVRSFFSNNARRLYYKGVVSNY